MGLLNFFDDMTAAKNLFDSLSRVDGENSIFPFAHFEGVLE